MGLQEGAGDAALEDADEGSLSGGQQAWQEAYYALLLLTRGMRHCPSEVCASQRHRAASW